MNIPRSNAWAEVELYRWQTGSLPDTKSTEPLNIPKALSNIAKGLNEGCKTKDESKMITPYNLCTVLNYLADNYEFE